MSYNEVKKKLYEQIGTPGSSQGANAGAGSSVANYDAMRNSLYKDIGVKAPKRYTKKSYSAAGFEAARGRAALWERQFRNVVEDMAQNGATEESRKRFDYLQSTYLDIAQNLSWDDIKPFSQLGESMTKVRQFLDRDDFASQQTRAAEAPARDSTVGQSEYQQAGATPGAPARRQGIAANMAREHTGGLTDYRQFFRQSVFADDGPPAAHKKEISVELARHSAGGMADYNQILGQSGFAKAAKSGWDQYLADQEAAAEDKRKTEEWLSRPHFGVSAMEMASMRLATDDTYKQPDERWTQEQRDVFGALYGQDKKKAEQFAIDTNNAYNSAEQEQQRTDVAAFAGEHPILATAGSLFADATGLGMADYLTSGIEKVARGTITQRGFVTPHQAAETATGAISQNLNNQYGTIREDIPVLGGHGLGDAYQLMNSIITSAATANTVGPLGTDIIFFGNAAASAMDDARERNATDEESLLMGLISGTAEAAGEHFSASHLLEMTDSRTIKKFFGSLFGQALEEGEEELFTSFVNNLADNYVMRDKSNFYQYVDAYMQNNPNATQEKAQKEAWKQMWSDMAFDALGGFVSGGVHTVGQVGINRVASNSAYKSIYGDSSAELVQQGLESPEGSESHSLAQEYQQKLDGGKKLSGSELRKLVQAKEAQIRTENLENDGFYVEENRERGTTEVTFAQKPDVSVQSALKENGFKWSKKSGKWFTSKSPEQARQTVREVMGLDSSAQDGTVLDADTQEHDTENDAVRARAGLQAAQTADTERFAAVSEASRARTASWEEESGAVQEDKPFTLSPTKGKTLLNLPDGSTEETQITGIASSEKGKLMLNVTGQSEPVRASSLSYASTDEAVLYHAINSMELLPAAAQELVKQAHSVENGGEIAFQVSQMYTLGENGVPLSKAMNSTYGGKLNDTMKEFGYYLGRRVYDANVQKAEAQKKAVAASQRARAISSGQKLGGVQYDGITATRGKDGSVQIEGITLNEQQKSGIQAAEMLASMGVNIHVFQSQTDANGKPTGEHGSYHLRDGSIHIDLNAGNDGQGVMAYTIAHEFTHFMEDQSPAMFQRFTDCLFEALDADVDGWINTKAKSLRRQRPDAYRNASREKLMEDARSEVVAEACETMLTDTDAARRIAANMQQKEPGLWEKVKQWFADLAKRLRKAYKGLEPGNGIAQEAKETIQQVDDLVQLWADMAVDAAENYRTAEAAEKEGNLSTPTGEQAPINTPEANSGTVSKDNVSQDDDSVKYSVRETDDGRMVAVVDDDILSHIDTTEWSHSTIEQAKTAARHALSKFSGGITVNGITRKVNKVSKKEFTRSKYTQYLANKDTGIFADKMRMADVADDVVSVTTGWGVDGGLTHPRNDNFVDFDHGTALIMAGSNKYNAEVVVGITGSGEYVFYDVTNIQPDGYKIKEEPHTNATTDKPIGAVNRGSSGDMVAQEDDSVKHSSRENQLEKQKADVTADAAENYREDSGPYSYESLVSKPDMAVTAVDGNAPNSRADVVYQAKQNAARIGKFNIKDGSVSVHVKDIDTDIILSTNGLKHGLDRRFETNAPVTLKAGEILANSIRINELTPAKAEAASSYVMIGAARAENGDLFIVQSVVNQFDNVLQSMEVLYSINAKKGNRPRSMRPGFQGPVTDSTISISELLDHVKDNFPDVLPEDVLKHYGYDARPNGKLGESALYSNRYSTEAALEGQNEKLRADVANLKELLRLQGKTTDGKTFKKDSLRRAANFLMRETGRSLDEDGRAELSDMLGRAYGVLSDENVTYDDIIRECTNVAQWLDENGQTEDAADEYASNILSEMKGIPIRLDETQKEEAKHLFGSLGEFRSRLKGAYKLANDGIPLDDICNGLSIEHPMYFDGDVSSADLPRLLVEAIDRLRGAKNTDPYQHMPVDLMMEKVYEGFWKARKLTTVADRYQGKINAIIEKHNAAMEKIKEGHKKEISDIRRQWDEEVKAVQASMKYDAEQELNEVIGTFKNQRKAAVENRHRTQYRQQIHKMADKFHKMATAPAKADTAHAPIRLVSSIAKFCEIFAESEARAIEFAANALDSRETNMRLMNDLRGETKGRIQEADVINRQRDRLLRKSQAISGMKEQYASIQKDSVFSMFYDEHVNQLLNDLDGQLSDTDIYEMNTDQLKQVYNTMQAMMYTITNANRVFSMEKDKTLLGVTRKLAREIDNNKVSHGAFASNVRKYGMWQMRPDTFFNFICGFSKDNEGKAIAKMFSDGTARMESVQRDFYQMFRHLTEAKDWKTAKHIQQMMKNPMKEMIDWGLKDAAGNPVKTTRDMMLQAYMLMNQEDSFRSLVYGGFKLPNAKMYYDGKADNAYGDAEESALLSEAIGESYMDLVHEIRQRQDAIDAGGLEAGTVDQLQKEIGELRSQAMELVQGAESRLIAMRDAIEKRLTDVDLDAIETAKRWYKYTGQLMTDVYLQMYGYKPNLVDGYVPIHRDLTTVKTDIREGEESKAFNLENSGFTKDRVRSVAPILLTGFFQELSSQQQKISKYYGFAQVQKDFNRIWNLRMPGARTTINTKVAAKYGTGKTWLGVSGEQYILNFIQSVAGVRAHDDILSKFYGNAASATLSANPRVAVSQLASIPTAAAVVGWKSMAVGFTKGISTSLSTQKKNLLANDSVWFFQRYRGAGGITELSDLKSKGGIWSKVANSAVGKHLFNWCQSMDVFATASMWAMAEDYVQSNGMKQTDEGYKLAVEQCYADIIRQSQPNYTVTERSDMLRDKRGGMKLLTMYKTQSNQNLNILIDAIGEYRAAKMAVAANKNNTTVADLKQANKRLVNGITSVTIGGTLAFVLLRTLVNFALGWVDPYRDEETGELTMEAFGKAVLSEAISSTAGMFALGGQLYDAVNSVVSGDYYYGISDTAVSSLAKSAENVVTLMQRLGDPDKDVEWKHIEKALSSTLATCGIPYKNGKRFVEGAQQWYRDLTGGTLGQYTTDASDKQYRTRILRGWQNGDTEKVDDALALLAARSEKDTDEEVALDVARGFANSYLKEKVKEGEVLPDDAMKLLEYIGHDDPEGVTDKWVFQMEHPDSELSDAGIRAWNNNQNIPLDLFEAAYKYKSANNRKADVVAYIQGLSVSAEMKRQLWNALKGSWKDKDTPWE